MERKGKEKKLILLLALCTQQSFGIVIASCLVYVFTEKWPNFEVNNMFGIELIAVK